MPGLPGRTEEEAGLGCSQWLEEATAGPRARGGDVMRQEGGGWPGQLQRAWLMVSVGDLLLGTMIDQGVGRMVPLEEALGENLFLVSSSPWWPVAFPGLCPHHSSLCLRGHSAGSSSV